LKTLKNLNHKERGKLIEVEEFRVLKVEKRKGLQLGQVWEFENYFKERLKALGIIQ